MGTMGYLSPEIVGSTHYTNKTDIWAVGVIVYELTQARPFVEGATDREKYRWLCSVPLSSRSSPSPTSASTAHFCSRDS